MRLPALLFVDVGFSVVPIIAALRGFKRDRRAALLLILYFGESLISESYATYLALHGIHNHHVLNFSNLFEYFVFVIYFRSCEEHNRWKKYYSLALVLFVLFWIYAKLTFEPLSSPAEYTHTLSVGILSFLALRSLVQILPNENIRLFGCYRFWVSLISLFYFFVSVVLNGYFNALTTMNIQQATKLWSVHWLISLSCKAIYSLAFLWPQKK